MAEFDALPGIGHACGHNLFGTYSVLAASIVKQFIDETGGEIRVYGTPGKKGARTDQLKAALFEKVFEDVDVALCVHPAFVMGKRQNL